MDTNSKWVVVDTFIFLLEQQKSFYLLERYKLRSKKNAIKLLKVKECQLANALYTFVLKVRSFLK